MNIAKKIISVITAVVITLISSSAAASDATRMVTPTLSSISFKNAKINESFVPTRTQYTITLDDPEITPTLNDYSIDGDANIFITYSTDETKHQTGIIATLEFEGGTTVYTFEYVNAMQYAISSDNILAGIDCYLGEVYPQINEEDTEYKLFIPSDMDSIRLVAIPRDVSAYCDTLNEIALNSDQEPDITVNVTASDASTRTYTFKIKRLNKTCKQVEYEMAQPNFKSLVEGQLYYQKPTFFIAVISALCGILILLLLVIIAKRLTIRAADDEETDFFDLK